MLLPRRVFTVLGITAVVVTSWVTATAISARSPSKERLTTVDLERLQDRIDGDVASLARQGIYVRTTGLAGRCTLVIIENLTMPNRLYLSQRYGHGACLRQATSPPAAGCPMLQRRDAGAPTSIPDVSDLGLYEAERRLVAAGFGFSIECPGESIDHPSRPSRYSPDALARVTRQCPAAGATLAAGAPVALQAEAVLPGGHRYMMGAFRGHVTCGATGLRSR